MSLVYFLKCNEYVKIGVTEFRISTRKATLQTGCPYKLETIGVGEARDRRHSEMMELALHDLFQAVWIRGEWYELEPVLDWLKCDYNERQKMTDKIIKYRNDKYSDEYGPLYDDDWKQLLKDANELCIYKEA